MAYAATVPSISEQAYIEGEWHSEIRHELIDGDMYAMAGAHKNHGRLVHNLSGELYTHLAYTPCESFIGDMKVKVEQNFFYPDLVVICEDADSNDYFTESPLLIIEVLSPSTRKLDKTLKRLAYQSLPSLQEYVLIEQDVVEIEVCRRTNQWQPECYYLDDDVYFASIEMRLSVAHLYARVDNTQMRDWLKAQDTAHAKR